MDRWASRAEQFLEEFRARLAKFGLELHANKTRLIELGRQAARNRKQRGEGNPETFTCLGFAQFCGKRRSDGLFIGWRISAKKRMVAKLKAVKAELQRWMHEPVTQVDEWLQQVATGYYQYHAVPGNLDRLRLFRHCLRRLNPLLDRRIPVPRVPHPYPEARFAVRHPR